MNFRYRLLDVIPTGVATGADDGYAILDDLINPAGVYSALHAAREAQGADLLVSIYPNPTSDYITIDTEESQGGTYKILNQAGKLFSSGSFESGEKLELPNLANGLYVVSIEAEGRTSFQKLIVRK